MSDGETPRRNNDQWAELSAIASQLSRDQASLSDKQIKHVGALAKYSRKTRKISYALFVSILIDVLLTVALTVIGFQVSGNTDDIQRSQTTTRQRVLCPLYTIFIQSQSEKGRKAAPDPKKYDEAFRVIREGYRTLNCVAVPSNPVPAPRK